MTHSYQHNYRTAGYWFASGWWFAQPRDKWVPDFSDDFANHCVRRRNEYDNGQVTSLPSIPDMWDEYFNDLCTLAETEETR